MVYIIAEAGVNHNGKLDLALQLVNIAKESGADAIKFQTFKAIKLASQEADKAQYQKESTDSNESQVDMLKKLELSYDEFRQVKEYCIKREIEFISTPFDLESADFLNELNVSTYKIGSGDLTNYPLLRKVAQTGKKMILSTGMSNMDEVENSVKYVLNNGCKELVVLHCISNYPTKNEDLNLNAIKTMKEKLASIKSDIEIGFSDHTEGIDASIYSVCTGATFIEKHFTISKRDKGVDSAFSMDIADLNNDGSPDLVFGNYGSPNFVYLNESAGQIFQAVMLSDNAFNTYDIICGDLNGDGYLDVIEANSDDYNLYYFNRIGNQD